MTIEVLHGNCLAIIPELAAAGRVVDACVTDPPYHLVPTVSRFGRDGSAPAKYGKDGAMARLSSGFMQAKWDGGDVAFRAETWAAVSTVLRPGAFLAAFGGTRTVHRLASAIEDAGFIIQDSILDMLASDARVQRFVATLSPAQADAFSHVLDDLQPTGALAWAFATGFPKRKDHLKPAFEPIVLAYKPGGKRTLQVDECRVETAAADSAAMQRCNTPRSGRMYASSSPIGTFARSSSSGELDTAKGRWPANVCHDGSDEVLACFPETETHAKTRANYPAPSGPSWSLPMDSGRTYDSDNGSAARFFFSAKQMPPCALCGWPCSGDDGIITPCSPASNAASNSPQLGTGKSSGSAQNNAPAGSRLDGEVRHHLSSSPAIIAEKASSRPPPIEQNTAHQNASTWPLEKIVQNVRSAAHLCGSCATAIAQSLAALRQGHGPEPLRGPASISETSKQILTRSLALYVAGRESTDIILTTPSLRELFGSVFHAIAENTNSERSVSKVNIGSGQKRLHFSSKAQSADRWGSRHPTIKPVDLIAWLVALVTPPGGTFLDPFAGSGTAAVAALKTGRNAILIEREDSYIADIRERLAFYEGGGTHSVQAKNRNRKVDHGPLFGGDAA